MATPVNLSRSDYCELRFLHFHGLPHRLCSWHRDGRLANAKEDSVEHRHNNQGQDGSTHQPEDDTHRHGPENPGPSTAGSNPRTEVNTTMHTGLALLNLREDLAQHDD